MCEPSLRIRPLLVTVPGIVLPHPYGGQDMQVMVNLDQQKLLARNLTPADIHNALMQQYLVLPSGDMSGFVQRACHAPEQVFGAGFTRLEVFFLQHIQADGLRGRHILCAAQVFSLHGVGFRWWCWGW